MRCPEEKEFAGFGVPAAAGELWILSWGIEAMQGTEISTLISQGQQKGSQGQCWELQGSRAGAGGIQGASREHGESRDCCHCSDRKPSSRRPELFLNPFSCLAFCSELSTLKKWIVLLDISKTSWLSWGVSVPEMFWRLLLQSPACLGVPAKGSLKSLWGRNQTPRHLLVPWAAERLQGLGGHLSGYLSVCHKAQE